MPNFKNLSGCSTGYCHKSDRDTHFNEQIQRTRIMWFAFRWPFFVGRAILRVFFRMQRKMPQVDQGRQVCQIHTTCSCIRSAQITDFRKKTCMRVVWSTQACMWDTHAIPTHMHNTQHTAISRSPAPAPAVLAWLPPNHQCHPRWCWAPRPLSLGAQTDCSCPWQTKRKKKKERSKVNTEGRVTKIATNWLSWA